ncbi:MAG: hypothetical protein K6F53_01185 [Lachnospiraceae bacterium]|nr:hypothetical protein [Lachnospiraceae bacterium]
MKKRASFGLNTGVSSILVIVVILCLVCFAGLSLASANADSQLSDKLAERTKSYYGACSEGYRALYEAKKDSSSEDPFIRDIPMNENQALRIEAVLSPETGNYEITRWQIVTISEPELDHSLTLYTGN